jgi:hypothetical protein
MGLMKVGDQRSRMLFSQVLQIRHGPKASVEGQQCCPVTLRPAL